MTQNTDFTMKLIELCDMMGTSMQYSSTANLYGNTKNFNENAPLLPESPYGWSKYLVDRFVQSYMKDFKINIQGFRYFNVYGNGEDHKGDQMSPVSKFTKQAINYLDYSITIFFVIEIIIRFVGEPKKLEFFKSGWNVFDTLIVLISLIPIPNNSSFLLLRLLRVFRVLRIISVVPELKKIIEALLTSVKRVFYVGLLLFIILMVNIICSYYCNY